MEQSKRRPGFNKKTRRGRPRCQDDCQFDVNSEDLFSHLFAENITSSSFCATLTVQNVKDVSSIVCAICQDIMFSRTVTTGCHYYCSTCISNYFCHSRTNTVPCPICYKSVDWSSVKAIDMHARHLLDQFTIQCFECRESGEIIRMKDHACEILRPDIPIKVTEVSIQTTPCNHIKPTSMSRSITSPLDKNEERLYTHLTRRKLHEHPEFLSCKTGGQSINFVKVTKARKNSKNAPSPLKKKRARELAKVRGVISGKDAICHQQSAELKVLSKTTCTNVCVAAGVHPNQKLLSKTMLAMKLSMGLTTNQMRKYRIYLKHNNITCASEIEKRKATQEIMPDNYLTSKYIHMWHKMERHPASIKGMVRMPSTASYISDLITFVSSHLDRFEAAGKLVFTDFPDGELTSSPDNVCF